MQTTSLKTDVLVGAGLLALLVTLVTSHYATRAQIDPRFVAGQWHQWVTTAQLVPMVLGWIGLRDLKRQGHPIAVETIRGAALIVAIPVAFTMSAFASVAMALTTAAAAVLAAAFALAMWYRLRD